MSLDNNADMKIKYDQFIFVRNNAIAVLNKYITQFSQNPENQGLVDDLKHGLSVLEGGKARIIREGVEGLEKNLLKYPRGKRPGLALSRGFGEFLYALPHEPWVDEIMDAVQEIEHYHASM